MTENRPPTVDAWREPLPREEARCELGGLGRIAWASHVRLAEREHAQLAELDEQLRQLGEARRAIADELVRRRLGVLRAATSWDLTEQDVDRVSLYPGPTGDHLAVVRFAASPPTPAAGAPAPSPGPAAAP